jgi:hypothetical protein
MIKIDDHLVQYWDKNDWDKNEIRYKYSEDKILNELKEYVDKTYSAHYKSEDGSAIQCLDVWFSLGSALTSCRDTAIKYLWRARKKGSDSDYRKDLMKAMHYIIFALHALDNEKK